MDELEAANQELRESQAELRLQLQLERRLSCQLQRLLDERCPEISQEEFGRMREQFPRAVLTAQKYGWSQERCVDAARRLELEFAGRGLTAQDDRDCFALDWVVKAIQSDKMQQHSQKRGLFKALRCITNQAEQALLGDLVGRWASQASEQLSGLYDRYLRKYQRAMLCGKKYDWSTGRCVKFGRTIDAQIKQDRVASDDMAAYAVELVVKAIQAEKLQAHNRQRGLARIVRLWQNQLELALMGQVVGRWASTAVCELQADFDRFLSKFQRAMLCGRKYEWSRVRCVEEGGKIEAELASKGVAEDQQAAAAVDLVVAIIKAEKAAAIKALKDDMQDGSAQ